MSSLNEAVARLAQATSRPAALLSCGKGPTLWREPGGPWNGLYKDEWHILADGDQVSLDWSDPEAAVFTVQQEQQAGYAPQQGGYEQQGYPQQGGYEQQGYDQQGYDQQGY